MKKITYILLAVTALFVNSTVYAVEARIPTTSITQALQNAKSKKHWSPSHEKHTKMDQD